MESANDATEDEDEMERETNPPEQRDANDPGRNNEASTSAGIRKAPTKSYSTGTFDREKKTTTWYKALVNYYTETSEEERAAPEDSNKNVPLIQGSLWRFISSSALIDYIIERNNLCDLCVEAGGVSTSAECKVSLEEGSGTQTTPCEIPLQRTTTGPFVEFAPSNAPSFHPTRRNSGIDIQELPNSFTPNYESTPIACNTPSRFNLNNGNGQNPFASFSPISSQGVGTPRTLSPNDGNTSGTSLTPTKCSQIREITPLANCSNNLTPNDGTYGSPIMSFTPPQCPKVRFDPNCETVPVDVFTPDGSPSFSGNDGTYGSPITGFVTSPPFPGANLNDGNSPRGIITTPSRLGLGPNSRECPLNEVFPFSLSPNDSPSPGGIYGPSKSFTPSQYPVDMSNPNDTRNPIPKLNTDFSPEIYPDGTYNQTDGNFRRPITGYSQTGNFPRSIVDTSQTDCPKSFANTSQTECKTLRSFNMAQTEENTPRSITDTRQTERCPSSVNTSQTDQPRSTTNICQTESPPRSIPQTCQTEGNLTRLIPSSCQTDVNSPNSISSQTDQNYPRLIPDTCQTDGGPLRSIANNTTPAVPGSYGYPFGYYGSPIGTSPQYTTGVITPNPPSAVPFSFTPSRYPDGSYNQPDDANSPRSLPNTSPSNLRFYISPTSTYTFTPTPQYPEGVYDPRNILIDQCPGSSSKSALCPESNLNSGKPWNGKSKIPVPVKRDECPQVYESIDNYVIRVQEEEIPLCVWTSQNQSGGGGTLGSTEEGLILRCTLTEIDDGSGNEPQRTVDMNGRTIQVQGSSSEFIREEMLKMRHNETDLKEAIENINKIVNSRR